MPVSSSLVAKICASHMQVRFFLKAEGTSGRLVGQPDRLLTKLSNLLLPRSSLVLLLTTVVVLPVPLSCASQGSLLCGAPLCQTLHRPGVRRQNHQHQKALGQRWGHAQVGKKTRGKWPSTHTYVPPAPRAPIASCRSKEKPGDFHGFHGYVSHCVYVLDLRAHISIF